MMNTPANERLVQPLIEMHAIDKVFKTPVGEIRVLKNIDVAIQSGDFVSVIGRSGSGKSTLINMLTGIDHPTHGTVIVDGTPIHTLSESAMSTWRGRKLGVVFQFFQLLPMLTLLENVLLPMDFCSMYAPQEREERALKLLERVGLADFVHKLPGAVSGGQQQSAAVARALANDPPILIADEPTGNLDSRTAEDVMQLFEELNTNGKTIIMVTHDRSLARRARRTLVISDGELIPEPISQTWPDLSHSRLLHLAHLLEPQHLTAGLELFTGARANLGCLLAGGTVEISGSTLTPFCWLTPAELTEKFGPQGQAVAGPQGAQVLTAGISAVNALVAPHQGSDSHLSSLPHGGA